jgi:hypothetical protein
MIRSNLLASPDSGRREAEQVAAELRAARDLASRVARKLVNAYLVARDRPGDPVATAKAQHALRRWEQSYRRIRKLESEVPVPIRFWWFGLIPTRQVYGVPGWANAKDLLPWWVRWAMVARMVR